MSNDDTTVHRHRPTAAHWMLALACMVATAIYWPGLAGPLIFDDHWNLAPVGRWLRGTDGFLAALLPNSDSVVFSRPLAMGSFMLTSWLHDSTWSLKLGNLVIHLACGLVAYRVLALALAQDAGLSSRARLYAAAVVTVWLLHPLHVSAVLYAVQRMALLASLCVLLSVWMYVAARRWLDEGRTSAAITGLFVCVPLFVVCGVLAKQNAVVAPLLCLAIELGYLRRGRMALPTALFHASFVVLPAIATVALLLWMPAKLLSGYGELEFTLWERLLSQPRALWEYIGMWFAPRTPQMGLYTDAYVVSTDWMSPLTTLPAIVALLVVSALSIRWRSTLPAFFVGWWWFLGAHAIESTFLPLEMYYEHRNYLPSIGLMLMAAGLVQAAAGRARLSISPKRLAAVLALLCVTLSFATLGRVLVWQTEYAMTEQGLRHHPRSIRVHLDRLSLYVKAKDFEGATRLLDGMASSDDPRMRMVARMDRASVACMAGRAPDLQDLAASVDDAQARLTVYEVHVGHFMDTLTRQQDCGADFLRTAADALVAVTDAAIDQPPGATNKTTMRRIAAQLYARADLWGDARIQAQLGWEGMQTLPLGSMLVRANLRAGDLRQAQGVYAAMQAMVRPYDLAWHPEMAQLAEMLQQRQASSTARTPGSR